MATKLSQMYSAMAARRRQLGVGKVFWYTWSSPYGRGGSIFNYAGLQRFDGTTSSASPRCAPTSGARGASRAARRRSPASASSAEQRLERAVDLPSAVRCQVSPAARSRPAAGERSRSGPAACRRAAAKASGSSGSARSAAPHGLEQGRTVRGHDRRSSGHRLDAREAGSPRRARAWRKPPRRRRAPGGRRPGRSRAARMAARAARWACRRASSRRSRSSPLSASSGAIASRSARFLRGALGSHREDIRPREPEAAERRGVGLGGEGRVDTGGDRHHALASARRTLHSSSRTCSTARSRAWRRRRSWVSARGARPVGAPVPRRAAGRALSWITTTLRRPGERREVGGERSSSAPRRERQRHLLPGVPGPVRERRRGPDRLVALRAELRQQPRQLARPALDTADLAPSRGARVDGDGRRRQDTRRRSMVPPERRRPPAPARRGPAGRLRGASGAGGWSTSASPRPSGRSRPARGPARGARAPPATRSAPGPAARTGPRTARRRRSGPVRRTAGPSRNAAMSRVTGRRMAAKGSGAGRRA